MAKRHTPPPGGAVTPDDVLVGILQACVTGVALAVLVVLENCNLVKASVFQVLSVAAFFGLIMTRLSRDPIRVVPNPVYVPLLAYAAVLLLSVLISPHTHHTVSDLLRFVSCFALFFVLVNVVTTRHRATRITATLVPVAAIAVAYGLVQRLGLDPIGWSSQKRLLSTFGNPNFFAVFLVALLPVFLSRFMSLRSRGRRLVYAILCLLCLLCLFLTFSRAAWIGCAVALVFMVGVLLTRSRLRRALKRSLVASVLGLILVMVTVLAAVPNVRNRVATTFRPGSGTGRVRLVIWDAAVRMWRSRPILGNGLGHFKVVFPHYRDREYEKLGLGIITLHVHNEYLEVLAETGVVGLAAFLAVLFILFTSVLKRVAVVRDEQLRVLTIGYLTGALAVLVHNAFSVNMRWTVGSFFFWLCAGMASACAGVEQLEKETRPGRKRKAKKPRADGRFLVEMKQPRVFADARVRWGLGLIGVVIVALLVGRHVSLLRSSYYLDRCYVAMARHDIDEATAAARKAIAADKHNYSAYYKLAHCLNTKGEYEAALSAYHTLQAIWPDYGKIHFNIGSVQMNLGRLREAEQSLLEATRFEKTGQTHIRLGNLYSDTGDPARALVQYEQAAAINPEDPDAWMGLGRGWQQQGDVNKALDCFAKAAQLDPGNAEAQFSLGRLYQDGGDFARSIAAYQESLRLEPNNSKTLTNLGTVHVAAGHLNAAVAAFRAAVRIEPDDVLAHLNLGMTLQDMGRLHEAVVELEAVVRINGNAAAVAEAQRRLTGILPKLGQPPSTPTAPQ